MIQIWPLWLKIGVWWCSVTFLVTFGILCVVRLILFSLMWIVGFRGIWLFPNLFDDNQTFAGSFIPIFGKGDPMTTDEDSDEEYWNYMRKKVLRDCCATFILKKNFAQVKKREKEGSEKDSSDADKKKLRVKKEDEPCFQFGWVNVVIIFGCLSNRCQEKGWGFSWVASHTYLVFFFFRRRVGALGCINLGFFDGENVPDFVAQRDDLEYYFKSLAPPEPSNETLNSGERDPFAAPEADGERQF